MTPADLGWVLVAGALLVVLIVRLDLRHWEREQARRSRRRGDPPAFNDAHRAQMALFQGGKAYWQ